MRKPFNIIFSTIAVLFFLLIATVCILPFIINPNNFKPEIVAAFKDHTGRELSLDGELTLSLFPWIGISTGKIVLSNIDGPFATLEESNIKVQLLPLFSKKVNISRITLKGLVLNLAKNKQGVANWADPSKASAPAAASSKQIQQSALVALAIGGFAVDQARINWDDQETGQHLKITDLNLNTDKFSFDQPVAIAASLNATGTDSATIQAIKLSTELTVNQQLDTFLLHHSDLQITTTGPRIPGKSLMTGLTIADMALDMTQQTTKIDGLQLKIGDMTLTAELSGSSIKDKPLIQGPVTVASFSPAKLLQQLSITLPAMQKDTALSKLAINFSLAATADSVDLQNLQLSLDDSQIKGSISLKNFIQPSLRFILAIDTLAVNHYLSPVNKLPIASPAMLLAVGFFSIPVEHLRKLDAEGTLSLNKLNVNGLTMQEVNLDLKSKNALITTKQSVKHFYQGSYVGDLRMDTKGDKTMVTINETTEHLQLEPLLKTLNAPDRIGGLVNISAQLQGQGRKLDELKTSLNGQLSFLIKDSVLKGFNLQKIIDTVKGRESGTAIVSDSKQEQMLFSEISGTATIINSLLQNNDLVAKSSKVQIDGKGKLNLNSAALDYKINAKPFNATEPVVINVTGTLDQPSYSLDIASLLTDQNKAKIDKLINKIDKKLGSNVGDLLKSFLK